MKPEQFLLENPVEEGGELSPDALKTQQLDVDRIHPGWAFSNAEQVHQEIDDLKAVIEIFNEDCSFGYVPNRKRIEDKNIEVNKYPELSENREQLCSTRGHPLSS